MKNKYKPSTPEHWVCGIYRAHFNQYKNINEQLKIKLIKTFFNEVKNLTK